MQIVFKILIIIIFIALSYGVLSNVWYIIKNLYKKRFQGASINLVLLLIQIAIIYFILYPRYFEGAIRSLFEK